MFERASVFVAIISLAGFSGCASLLRPFEMVASRAEAVNSSLLMRQQIQAESARLRQAEATARQAERLAQQEAAINVIKRQRASTIPVVEARVGMNWQQGFSFGKPELDLAELKDRVVVMESGHDQRLESWKESMQDWQKRRDQHFRDEWDIARDSASGKNGCQTVPQDIASFDEPPPEKPRVSMFLSDLPLKMSVRMVSRFDDTFLEDARTRRIPTNVKVPCDQEDDTKDCDGSCSPFGNTNRPVLIPGPVPPVPEPETPPSPSALRKAASDYYR
jgi:hypothetical protein